MKARFDVHGPMICGSTADPAGTGEVEVLLLDRRCDDNRPNQPSRVLYGRRQGRPVRARQARLLSTLLPKLRIAPDAPDPLDPRPLFDFAPRAVRLEIGFGSAEHLVWQAEHNRDVGFIGAEPYVNGVAKLLVAVEERGIGNIRIHDDDARTLLGRLAPASLELVYILFPDPWPKARHHKRRIINDDTVAALARALRPGGIVRIASDIDAYKGWILEHMRRAGAYDWLAERADDWRIRPADWPATRYELKAVAAGRRPAFLTFRRV